MGGLFSFFYPWGVLLQLVAIVHFIRRRPDTIWFYLIIFLGPPGAFVYILVEVLPDLALLRDSMEGVKRRKRINHLEAMVLQNPSAGNHEELGDLYLDEGQYAKALACYDKSIATKTNSLDAVYRRGVAKIHLRDFPGAAADLEQVTAKDQKYDFHRATALLAHAYANTGSPEKADEFFKRATELSTSSETYLNYAAFLAAQNRPAEARDFAQRVLDKKPAMPRYLQRRERPWFRQAKALLKRLPA